MIIYLRFKLILAIFSFIAVATVSANPYEKDQLIDPPQVLFMLDNGLLTSAQEVQLCENYFYSIDQLNGIDSPSEKQRGMLENLLNPTNIGSFRGHVNALPGVIGYDKELSSTDRSTLKRRLYELSKKFNLLHNEAKEAYDKRFNSPPPPERKRDFDRLWRAVTTADLATISDLLLKYPDLIHYTDRFGGGLLHWAVRIGNEKVSVLLLKKGANVNQRGSKGKTPLMAAAFSAKVEMVGVLLEAGADTQLDDDIGFNAIDHAVMKLRDTSDHKPIGQVIRLLRPHYDYLNKPHETDARHVRAFSYAGQCGIGDAYGNVLAVSAPGNFRYCSTQIAENRIRVVTNGPNSRTGFADASWNMAIPIKFDEAKDFSEGLAAVRIDYKWGFIDVDGKIVIEPQFTDVAESFKNGEAIVRSVTYPDGKDKRALPDSFTIDRTGKRLLSFDYTSRSRKPDLEETYPKFEKKRIDGEFRSQAVDRDGEILFTLPRNSFIGIGNRYYNGRIWIGINNLRGCFDTAGNCVVTPRFEWVRSFTGPISDARLPTGGFRINEDGRLIPHIPPADGKAIAWPQLK